jgi:hypothetical protein
MWMKQYFDDLPRPVRRRLRNSAFNLCPACLVEDFMQEVRSRHPEYSRERALLVAIEVMETQVHQGTRPGREKKAAATGGKANLCQRAYDMTMREVLEQRFGFSTRLGRSGPENHEKLGNRGDRPAPELLRW